MATDYLTELESIVLRYNKVAMDYLKLDNHKETLILLKKAEHILSTEDSEDMPSRLKLVSITFNNLGCYYKKCKKPLVALHYLQKALDIEIEIDSDNANIASSHLNICAILSSLSRHEDALPHAKKAIQLLEAVKISLVGNLRGLSNLVVAYYNSAVELEHTGKLHEALNYYSLAMVTCRDIGSDHPLLKSIEYALEKVKAKLGSLRSEKHGLRDNSPLRSSIVGKHMRLPSITPAPHRPKYSRSIMTPGKVVYGRVSPYDNLKNITIKGSL
jgi:tetratricopeptide (TPR) repeat protein